MTMNLICSVILSIGISSSCASEITSEAQNYVATFDEKTYLFEGFLAKLINNITWTSSFGDDTTADIPADSSSGHNNTNLVGNAVSGRWAALGELDHVGRQLRRHYFDDLARRTFYSTRLTAKHEGNFDSCLVDYIPDDIATLISSKYLRSGALRQIIFRHEDPVYRTKYIIAASARRLDEKSEDKIVVAGDSESASDTYDPWSEDSREGVVRRLMDDIKGYHDEKNLPIIENRIRRFFSPTRYVKQTLELGVHGVSGNEASAGAATQSVIESPVKSPAKDTFGVGWSWGADGVNSRLSQENLESWRHEDPSSWGWLTICMGRHSLYDMLVGYQNVALSCRTALLSLFGIHGGRVPIQLTGRNFAIKSDFNIVRDYFRRKDVLDAPNITVDHKGEMVDTSKNVIDGRRKTNAKETSSQPKKEEAHTENGELKYKSDMLFKVYNYNDHISTDCEVWARLATLTDTSAYNVEFSRHIDFRLSALNTTYHETSGIKRNLYKTGVKADPLMDLGDIFSDGAKQRSQNHGSNGVKQQTNVISEFGLESSNGDIQNDVMIYIGAHRNGTDAYPYLWRSRNHERKLKVQLYEPSLKGYRALRYHARALSKTVRSAGKDLTKLVTKWVVDGEKPVESFPNAVARADTEVGTSLSFDDGVVYNAGVTAEKTKSKDSEIHAMLGLGGVASRVVAFQEQPAGMPLSQINRFKHTLIETEAVRLIPTETVIKNAEMTKQNVKGQKSKNTMQNVVGQKSDASADNEMSIKLLHVNCEGCEYEIIPDLIRGKRMEYLNIATHYSFPSVELPPDAIAAESVRSGNDPVNGDLLGGNDTKVVSKERVASNERTVRKKAVQQLDPREPPDYFHPNFVPSLVHGDIGTVRRKLEALDLVDNQHSEKLRETEFNASFQTKSPQKRDMKMEAYGVLNHSVNAKRAIREKVPRISQSHVKLNARLHSHRYKWTLDTPRELEDSIARYCDMHRKLSENYEFMQGIPWVWERWKRK